MSAYWIVERTQHRRLPFRISIVRDERLVLAVRAQSSWPGPGQNIFCLRERHLDPDEPLEPIERVPVLNFSLVGRKLTLVLDRPMRKRCEFLTVLKERKGGGTPLEQVFFRTEAAIRAHRSRTRLELRAGGPPLTIVVDSAERYAWRFPGASTERRKLAVGDYALVANGRVLALVERKSFDNLLGDIGALQALHHQLADLASHAAAAVVIEAQYGDFLNERRLAGRWPAAHVARVIAEISALHPRLPIVFAGNRKLANAWCLAFFTACSSREAGPQLSLVRESLQRYGHEERPAGLDDDIRREALLLAGAGFTTRELGERIPAATPARIRRVLERMERAGQLLRPGRARDTRWTKA